VDEGGEERLNQLSVAVSVKRDRQVLTTDFRQVGLCGDMPMEELHQAPGHTPGFHCHGFHHDAVRED
jgi:hypothetical protein